MAISSTRSEIVDDLDYQNAPESVDAEVLEQWVAAFREGDNSYRDRLVRAHLRVVKTTADVVAARCNKRHLKSDLVAQAFLILMNTMDSAQTELTDNQITPYIVKAVRFRLMDYIAKERSVYMPARTFRDKKAKGEEIRGLVFEAGVSSFQIENDDVEQRHSARDERYAIPIAPPEDVSPEFAEAMELAIVTEEERKVIDLRIEGYKYRDYESALGLNKTEAAAIVSRVRRRFNEYYA